MDIRLRLLIHGRVQGIGFRFSTVRQAQKLDLTGWVRNNPDGTVEIVTEGEKENLQKLLAWCQRGPLLAQVDKIDTSWEEATGEFENFDLQ